MVKARTGGWLWAYLAASRLIPLAAGPLLRKRLARGREDPARWREKLGYPSEVRPEGQVVWLHAVGLGEVLALRGLIGAMARLRPDLWFLVTSGTRTSASVFGANLPARTIHQFLPLDAPSYVGRFLDHWRPCLSIWAEQDIWPGAVVATHARGVPLALVNARMNGDAFGRRKRVAGLYRDLFGRFALMAAQNRASADHIAALCPGAQVAVMGSLKAAAPPLSCDEAELATLKAALGGRDIWLAASTHAEDEAVALGALGKQLAARPATLLILAPRDVARGGDLAQRLQAEGVSVALRSTGDLPGPGDQVWLADTYGEMGLWYRLAPAALMGGSFGKVEGHNPWEPAALGCAVLHGPRVANFAADYGALDAAGAALQVSADGVAAALARDDLALVAGRASALSKAAAGALEPLAKGLLALIGEAA